MAKRKKIEQKFGSFDYAERTRKEAIEKMKVPSSFFDNTIHNYSTRGTSPDFVSFDEIDLLGSDQIYETQRKIYDSIVRDKEDFKYKYFDDQKDANRIKQEFKLMQEVDNELEIKRLKNVIDDQRKDLREKSKLVDEYKELVQEQRAVINELKKELYRKED